MSDIRQFGNFLTFDDIVSNEYYVWISGEGTYDSPDRDVELLQIPGRSGDLLQDNGRFQNVDITYPCFISKGFESRFDEFRAKLMSKAGKYFLLSDTYHPNEFRMAMIRGAIQPQTGPYNRSGRFNLVFSCKPQRYLKNGVDLVELPETVTVFGPLVSFDDAAAGPVAALTVQMEPIQSGSGDPSPENVRPISGRTGLSIYVSPTQDALDGTTYAVTFPASAGTVYGGTLDVTTGELTVAYQYGILGPVAAGGYWQIAGEPSTAYPSAYVYSNGSIGTLVPPNASQDITGILCSHLPSTSRAAVGNDGAIGVFQYHQGATNQVRFAFPREDRFSTNAKLNAYLTEQIEAGTPVALCVPLKNPRSYTLTPIEVTTLLGANNIWSDAGDVTVTYYKPAMIDNPTLFPSRPSIRVYGYGTVTVGNVTMTIEDHGYPYMDIDCEAMSAFWQTVNLNSFLTLSTLEFPTLAPGENELTFSGVEKVQIMPRWYTL